MITEIELNKLKYPIGQFDKPKIISENNIESWITDIESFPFALEKLTQNLSIEQLSWRYRPDGWMIKQVVHHCADSHINSLIRFKLALTEKSPVIRPYHEDKWAELHDSLDDDLYESIALLTSLHRKWVKLLRSLSNANLKEEFVHPEHGQRFSLEENIGVYAWHSNHHLEHIRQALKFEGRFN